MRPTDRSVLASVIAVALATVTVLPLTVDRGFLVTSWFLLVVLGGLSAVLRRLRIGSATVLLVLGLTLLLFSLALSVVLRPGGFVPWYQRYALLWGEGIEHMATQASPMDPDLGVTLIFVTVIGVIYLMTDLLVLGVNRPAWAIAPPATLFLVPAIGLGSDTGIGSFLLVALGYLGILATEGLNTTARWTRGLSADSAAGYAAATPVVWRAAGLLAAPAIVLTVVLGMALPTLALPGLGIGGGVGNGPLQLTDPTLDLRRNLNQPGDRTVIEYRTDAPGGHYLRMASLPQLSAAGWSNVPIRLNSGDQLGPIPGLRVTPGAVQRTDIRVLDFGSQYLPMPYAPRRFEAAGDWRSDASSLVVVNADNDTQALRGMSYSVESVDTAPDRNEFTNARVGTPSDVEVTTEVPRDVPQSLIALSHDISDDAPTPAAKAAVIQSYLRSDRFTYSTERLPGGGYEALENFLLVDRTGYCEQFAAAMALMARVEGIPSRVSIGFRPGEKDGDRWRVSIQDMHAWPELYFADYGWVRFEPTPASLTGSAPPWTVPNQSSPEEEPSAEPTAGPTEASNEPTTAPSSAPTETTAPTEDAVNGGWLRTGLVAVLALVLLCILAAPATIRIRRRSARLNTGGLAEDQVEAAWREIRDSVLDYGGTWPDGSPRSIGETVGDRLDAAESASMTQVATLVERSRYARALGVNPATDELPKLTDDVRRGLAAPQSRPRQLLAFLVPRSLFRRGQHED